MTPRTPSEKTFGPNNMMINDRRPEPRQPQEPTSISDKEELFTKESKAVYRHEQRARMSELEIQDLIEEMMEDKP